MTVKTHVPLITCGVGLGAPDLRVTRSVTGGVHFVNNKLHCYGTVNMRLGSQNVARMSVGLASCDGATVCQTFRVMHFRSGHCKMDVVNDRVMKLIPVRTLVSATSCCLKLRGFSVRRILRTRVVRWCEVRHG